MRMSAARARQNPPPMAAPLTAAIPGWCSRRMVEMTSSSSSMERSAIVGRVNPSMLGMVPGFSWSAPEQKPRPAPVMTTMRTSLSLPISRRASRKGIMTSKAMAFMRSGRLRVTTATWGWGRRISVSDTPRIVGCRVLRPVRRPQGGSAGRRTGISLDHALLGRCGARRPLLAGDPPETGGAGVPVVDDGGAGDVVVERAAVALVHNAEESDAQREGQGDPEPDRPEDGLASADGGALVRHHLQPEDGHAERLAAHRPLVREVEEFPERQHNEGRQLVVAQCERVSGHQLERGVEQGDAEGVQAPRGPDVRGETADRAGVVALAADRERGGRYGDRGHVGAPASGATRSGGPLGHSFTFLPRPMSRLPQRRMKSSNPTPCARTTSRTSVRMPVVERAMMEPSSVCSTRESMSIWLTMALMSTRSMICCTSTRSMIFCMSTRSTI